MMPSVERWPDLPRHAHAIYAGSFDPITTGHLNVLDRACRLFARVTVLVAINPSKTNSWFSPHERVSLISDVVASARFAPKVRVAHTSGFVAYFAAEHHAAFLIRGVRDVTDAEDELKLARLNHELAPNVETVFLPAHGALTEVSSSKLKVLARAGDEDALRDAAPEPVVKALLWRAKKFPPSPGNTKVQAKEQA